MAQAQIQFTDDSLTFLRERGFKHVSWSPISKTITCVLDDIFSLIIVKRRHKIAFTLRKGTQTISLPYSMISNLCDLKESIQLLHSFLDGQPK